MPAANTEKYPAELRKRVVLEYIAGYKPRTIQQKYSLPTAQLIHEWARAAGFSRDVSHYVREAAQWKLLEISPDTTDGDVYHTAIERGANQHARVLRKHRILIEELMDAVEEGARLSSNFMKWAAKASMVGIEEAGEPPYMPLGPKESVSSYIYSTTCSLEKLVKLQRQAYRIKDEEEDNIVKAEDLVLEAEA